MCPLGRSSSFEGLVLVISGRTSPCFLGVPPRWYFVNLAQKLEGVFGDTGLAGLPGMGNPGTPD